MTSASDTAFTSKAASGDDRGSAEQNVRWTGPEPELASENVTTDVLTMRALLLDGPSESLQLQPETVARPRSTDGEVVVERECVVDAKALHGDK